MSSNALERPEDEAMGAWISNRFALRMACLVGGGAMALVGPAQAAGADATSPRARYLADATYADATGNHPPATPSGGVVFGPGSTGAPGDRSFRFNGTGSVVTDAGVGSFGTGPFDVSFSLKTRQNGTVELISKRSTCSNGAFFDIRLNNGQLVGEIDGGSPADYTVLTDGIVNDGVWRTITLRRTSTTLEFLVNGLVTNQTPIVGNPNVSSSATTTFADGPCVGVDGTQKLVGNLDNVTFSPRPGPTPAVPEAPAALLLPASGALLAGGFLITRRRRPALRTTA